MKTIEIYKALIESPVGPLLCGASEKGIVAVYYHGVHRRQPAITDNWREDGSRFGELKTQLAEYFEGRRREFTVTLDLDFFGTPFFRAVWQELRRIPYGETISYASLARRIGRPKAVRAVGMANGRNPLSIIVPCHRVIASNGKLTGYAGGLETKRVLLDLEGRFEKSVQ